MDKEAIKSTLEDLQNAYDNEFSKERRDNGTSGVLYDAKTTIESLIEELDQARALHREEQRRSADRLREIKDWLKDALSRNQIVHEIDRTQAREFVERNPK